MTTKNLQLMEALAAEWRQHKAAEEAAVSARRAIEDQLVSMAGVAETLEGTETLALGQYSVKIVGRIDRKVDGDKVQDLAAEHGLTDHLSRLFRWKPELVIAAWKAADSSITALLAPAITAKSGRPSFKIEEK